MFRKIYRRFPILTWLIAQLLLFCVECAREEGMRQYRFAFADCRRGGCDYFVHQLRRFIQKERALDLQGSAHCMRNPDLRAYVYAVRRNDHGSNRRRNLYAEVEAMYDCLKEYEFEKMEIDPDNGAVILYPAEEGGEEVVVHYRDRGALKYLKRKIRDARSFENGILFAAGYSWDGDWYALYVSENPDDQWLGRMNAEQIVPGVYDVLVPWNDL